MAKATKKQALGRGLSALLQETPNINSASDKNADKLIGSIIEIELSSIDVNPFQPRTYFDEETILRLIQQITPEKNSIIEAFENVKISAKNAMESQALIELKNNYCTKKRCLQCAIGIKLIRNN